MRIREYCDEDLAALRRMHASQGFAYPFPDLGDPIFISKLVLEDDAGRPAMASLARLTCEMYLLVDRDEERHTSRDANRDANREAAHAGSVGTTAPRQRYAQLLALHDAGARDLIARGLDDAHAWLPPRIAKRFGRRLTALGWIRDDAWTPYCKRFVSK